MEGSVGHWRHNWHQGSIHAWTKRCQPIVYQDVLQSPKRWQSQIYPQKWHGIVERCVPCQHLILKAQEKSAGQRIQGRVLDKPEDSTWVFSFHPEATRQAHTQGIQKHGCNKFCCQHVASMTKVHLGDAGGWVWQMIKNQTGQCLRPILLISFCRPMSGQVEHVGVHPLRYCLYVPFSNPIMMLGTHPTEWKLLLLLLTMLLEVGSSKNPIIQMVRFDFELLIPCNWFEVLGTLYCFTSIVGILWKIEYLAPCVVHKQAAALVSDPFLFKCMQEATGNRWEIVVSGNTIARSKMIRLEHFLAKDEVPCLVEIVWKP